MSWSVSACGPASKIAEQLEQQFERVNMNDAGEQETVQHARKLISQALGTMDPERPIRVMASGSMGFKEWTSKSSPYQSVDLKIEPIHFSV
jgi:hypothetical protein